MRASEVEIVDGEYVRPQQGPNADAEEMIESIAWLMDRSIPIGGMRVGIDPILGLIPGVGDVLSSLISAVLIVQAHRSGAPKATVLRMVTNVGIDAAVGSVPFVGDLFDFAFKANSKNLELYRKSVRGQHRASTDWAFLAVILVVLLAILAIPVVLGIWALQAIF